MHGRFLNIDSLIFDMDGTLWNATESYAQVWNATCADFGIEAHFTGHDLEQFMGMSISDIMSHLLGGHMGVDNRLFLQELERHEYEMMPRLGGVLYPNVIAGLESLRSSYSLFLLSNCSSRGLVNFVNVTSTQHLFKGLLSQGERPVSKCDNLLYMKQRYRLSAPAYVGDTQADCDQAHKAGIPFIFVEWGFGTCVNPDWSFSSFEMLEQELLRL